MALRDRLPSAAQGEAVVKVTGFREENSEDLEFMKG